MAVSSVNNGVNVQALLDAREALKTGADGVVVGTALVEALRRSLVNGRSSPHTVNAVAGLVAELAGGVRDARMQAAE